MNRTIDNSQDILDVRDIIERVEELESFAETADYAAEAAELWQKLDEAGGRGVELADRIDALNELVLLSALLSELKGNGGDEQWRGDWYPVTLVRDSYFKDYAQELAEDCGMVDYKALQWPLTCIDWEQAARELRMDYSSVEFDGVTYWYR